ncbi:alpha/beta-hydrolase [Chloropicon primus]|uniref:Alpha/beta-hydrolase n=1 Tax=Chloropicon primus TaxID=1764295 RepID=A0A5B8MZD7_9CHLO|nr:alpha/beta-hydrolase [Chloropicon primus]UPR04623.1 alpha/beta-hydrolase [Chloropicon primus]|eukprot:QDZ25426.1 alpha/beta-hydrolase [Chloropicon primus]
MGSITCRSSSNVASPSLRHASQARDQPASSSAKNPRSGPVRAKGVLDTGDVRKGLDLDFVPRLSFGEDCLCIAGALTSACLAFVLQGARRPALSLLCGCVVGVTWRFLIIEKAHSRLLCPPEELAEKNSSFSEVKGVLVHYKKVGSGAKEKPVIHCSHGFGASLYSWSAVQDKLSEGLQTLVVAHDTPGFGLTHRPRDLCDFTLRKNADISLGLVDLVREEGGADESLSSIWMGHSMGCVSAGYSAVACPDQTSSLVFVAPAIPAASVKGASAPPSSGAVRLPKRGGIVSKLALLLLKPFALIVLRALVRSKAFWEKSLAIAFYNKAKVDDDTVDGYRKAKLVQRWDIGILMFAFAQLSEFGKTNQYLLHHLVAMGKEGKKIIIIHGENDNIVPVSNSRKLASLIPNSELHVIPKCGHNPQEEVPDTFVDILTKQL